MAVVEDLDRATDSPAGWVAEHVQRYLETDGAEGHQWNGVPCLVLVTTGRRSGEPRRTALIYGRSGDDLVVVASRGGAPSNPAWYDNLLADPLAAVQVGAERYGVRARTADGAERGQLWTQMAAIWPDYDAYATRTDREIPVVVLQRT